MQRSLIRQEFTIKSNFHFSFKPDYELYHGVYGDWVHAWHLWPRGLPTYTRWLQIACAEPPVDLFKLRTAIFSEREREGIGWDCHAHAWRRVSAGSDSELRDLFELWEMRTPKEWLAITSENRAVDVVSGAARMSVPLCGGCASHFDAAAICSNDLENETAIDENSEDESLCADEECPDDALTRGGVGEDMGGDSERSDFGSDPADYTCADIEGVASHFEAAATWLDDPENEGGTSERSYFGSTPADLSDTEGVASHFDAAATRLNDSENEGATNEHFEYGADSPLSDEESHGGSPLCDEDPPSPPYTHHFDAAARRRIMSTVLAMSKERRSIMSSAVAISKNSEDKLPSADEACPDDPNILGGMGVGTCGTSQRSDCGSDPVNYTGPDVEGVSREISTNSDDKGINRETLQSKCGDSAVICANDVENEGGSSKNYEDELLSEEEDMGALDVASVATVESSATSEWSDPGSDPAHYVGSDDEWVSHEIFITSDDEGISRDFLQSKCGAVSTEQSIYEERDGVHEKTGLMEISSDDGMEFLVRRRMRGKLPVRPCTPNKCLAFSFDLGPPSRKRMRGKQAVRRRIPSKRPAPIFYRDTKRPRLF